MASPTIEAGYASEEHGLGLPAQLRDPIEFIERPPTPQQEIAMYEREGVHLTRYKGTLVLVEELRSTDQTSQEVVPMAA